LWGPDLVLLDFNLLCRDGPVVLRLRRENHPLIPVISVTNSQTTRRSGWRLKLGAIGQVLKQSGGRSGPAISAWRSIEYPKANNFSKTTCKN
jgi:CheY-like chemotaxis protein